MKKNSFYFVVIILVSLTSLGYIFRTERLHLLQNEAVKVLNTDSSEVYNNDLNVDENVVSVFLPPVVTFCNEEVPLHLQSVKESMDYELVVNTYRHSRTLLILKKLNRWRTEIDTILKQEGVPLDLFYVAVAESELNNNARSHVGAMGMWQFMERTGKEYGMINNRYIDQRRDPVVATRAACKYFKRAYNRFGNWTLAAASYNMGMTGVSNRIKKQGVNSYYDLYLNRETARYVYRILAFKQILENPEQYGFNLAEDQLYEPFHYREIVLDSSVNDLIDYAKSHNTNYKELRRLNPWLNNSRDFKLVLKKGQELKIKIPIEVSLEKEKELAVLK